MRKTLGLFVVVLLMVPLVAVARPPAHVCGKNPGHWSCAPTTTTEDTTTTQAPTTTSSTTTQPPTTTTTPGLATSEPIRITGDNVTIDGVHFTGSSGNCIHIEGASNITIRNSRFTNCHKGVYALNSANVTVEGSFFEADQTDRGRNAVQFDKVQGGTIAGNTVVAVNGGTLAEDHLSVYKSSDITVSGNHLSGGGPSTSGSGIMVGDGGGTNILAEHNVLVNPGQVGIGVASGQHISILNNQIFSESFPWSNVGLYVWNQYSSACSDITVSGNQIDWLNASGNQNNRWNSGNCGVVAGW